MTYIDYEYIPICELEINETLSAEIGFKPLYASAICFVVGILFLFTKVILAMALGVFFIAIALLVHFGLKDYKTLGIYQTFLIVYDSKDSSKGRKIMYDEIIEWNCKNSERVTDAVMIKLDEFETIYKDTFQTGKAYKELCKFIRDKETYVKKEEENKKKKLVFRGFKGFKGFKKKNNDE